MVVRSKSDALRISMQRFPAVGLLGTRQIGKTTLARTLPQVIDREVLFLDLESPEDLQKLAAPEDYLKQHLDKCVVIDEIQIRPGLFSILRPLIDIKLEPARYAVLGSASPTLIKHASETLAGRIAYVELAGFNLLEIGFEYMDTCWFRGGYPRSYLAGSDDECRQWLDSFIDNYIKRELPQLGLRTSSENIRRFWQMAAHANGQLWSTAAFAKALKLSNKTIDRYRDFLEGAFLINVLQPFHTNTKKRLVKSPKVFIRDSGILHRKLRIPDLDTLYGMVQVGPSWEGFVFEQIRQLKHHDIDLHFFRTQNGAEVDLVFSRAGLAIATAEIKLSNAPKTSKGQMECIKTLHTTNNFIITPRSDDYTTRHGIRICSLKTFLQEYLPLIK